MNASQAVGLMMMGWYSLLTVFCGGVFVFHWYTFPILFGADVPTDTSTVGVVLLRVFGLATAVGGGYLGWCLLHVLSSVRCSVVSLQGRHEVR